MRRHLAEFLGRCEERAGPLPAFVKAELEGFAGYGDFELGFVRTCCRSCGDELRVPFSCKSRGCCPSGSPSAWRLSGSVSPPALHLAQYRYTAPAALAALEAWSPPMPVALLVSKGAATAKVLPSLDSALVPK